MARFFFDIHGAGTAEWDDEGKECPDREAVEQHAVQLLTESASKPDSGAYGQPVVSATVHTENAGVILTATMKIGQPPRLVWSKR